MRMWVIALALLVPVAGASQVAPGPGLWNDAGPTDIRLNFHVQGVQDFPISTQPVDEAFVQSEALGIATNSQGCTDLSGVGLIQGTYHTYYGFGTLGRVAYDEEGALRYAFERGLQRDLVLDDGFAPITDWYLETQALGTDDPAGVAAGAPVVVPNVVVRATWREGDQISVANDAYNEGPIIAQGSVGPVTLQPQVADPAVSHAMVDGRHVYGFHIPMDLQTASVDHKEGMNVRIDVYMDNPACNDPDSDSYVMPHLVRVHSSADHRPGMDIRIFDALRVAFVHASFINETLEVFAEFSSPFGSYDVPDEGLSGRVIDQDGLALVAADRRCYHHMCSDDGLDTWWTWAYAAEGIRDGSYLIEITGRNIQDTAQATAVLGVDIGSRSITSCNVVDGQVQCSTAGQPDKQSVPGVPAIALLGALLGLTMRRRGQ